MFTNLFQRVIRIHVDSKTHAHHLLLTGRQRSEHMADLIAQGGILQGVGMAVMEELLVEGGEVRNPNFTDYLLPTILDAPDVEAVLIEEPDHWGPFGAKGVGESPTISSTAAVVAAVRAATGRPLTRAPIKPEDIAGV